MNRVYVSIKQYCGTVIVGIQVRHPFKNHPKDIVCNENHLCKTILVHLTSIIVFTTREQFQEFGYWILKIAKT